MKRLHIIALSMFAVLSLSAQTAKLPVLKVNIEKNNPLTDKNKKGTMVLTDVDDSKVELAGKFKLRGATAREFVDKPSFNMKLRDAEGNELDSTLLALRKSSSWILDAMAIDRVCMRNRVAFDIWNEYSKLPYPTEFGSRNGTVGKFVEVYLNDEYKGIYCLSDKVNRSLLNLKKVQKRSSEEVPDTIRGVLYKSGTGDIENQNERNHTDDWKAYTVEWHDAWELSEPEDYECEAAWQPLLDAYDNGKNLEYIKKYFFLQQLAENQVFIMALRIQDNWGNKNHFFSIRNIQKDINDTAVDEDGIVNGDRRRFVITPWDLDTSLGGHYRGAFYDGKYNDEDGMENWTPSDAIKNGGHFPYFILQGSSEYQGMLKEAWERGRAGALSVESVKAKLEGYRDLFVNSGAWARMYAAKNSLNSMMVEDLTKEIGYLVEWYKARYQMMDQYFGIESAIENVRVDQRRDGKRYNLSGQRVDDSYKGIYILNGVKHAN